MKEFRLTDPTAAVHQLLMEQGDLPCGSSETDAPDTRPKKERFNEAGWSVIDWRFRQLFHLWFTGFAF
jgi:hypothetical protein